MATYDNNLYYLCSLIEYIGRKTKNKRYNVVVKIGSDGLKSIYNYADVYHCEPIEAVADEMIRTYKINTSDFDNINNCLYTIPSYWQIGKVYERLIEDVSNGDVIKTLKNVYASKQSDAISDYNSAVYYQPRSYQKACYEANDIL